MAWLRAKAAQCHRLAKGVANRPDISEQLKALGRAYEAQARAQEARACEGGPVSAAAAVALE